MTSTSGQNPAYNVNLDPEAARQAVENGGTLLLLDVPEGTYFGLDHQAFVIGPKFKGVKMLPPGVHFVAYHAPNKHGVGFAAVIAFFFCVSPGDVVIKKWDAASETMEQLTDSDQEDRLRAGVKNFDFDGGLAPYDLQRQEQWSALSRYITQQLVDKLSPVTGNISITLEAVNPDLMAPETDAEKALQEQLRAGRARHAGSSAQDPEGGECSMEVDCGQEAQNGCDDQPSTSGRTTEQQAAARSGRCFYTHLPRLVKKGGATAAQLTALNLDKTPLLEQLIRDEFGGVEDVVLGELQFAFIAFVFGQSLDGLMQWKALLQLLLCCEDGPLRSRRQLFVNFMQVLTSQLRLSLSPAEKPMGVPMMDELLRDSFLWQLLSNYFQLISEAYSEVTPQLMAEVQSLKHFLKDCLDWDFDVTVLEDEDDEYAPVVVDLPGYNG